MAVASYVFIDLETTGLPREECNRTKITELSLVAVKREHLLATRVGATPRIQHKLTLCFNPRKMVSPEGSKITGLSNELLEHEADFNLHVFNLINTFLNLLTKPVCLVAHNGLNFDFPILKRHVEALKVSFSDDLLCADCFHAFYDIQNKKSITEAVVNVPNLTKDEIYSTDLYMLENTLHMKSINEKTPRKISKYANSTINKAKRRFPWSAGEKPKDSYKLKDIYERLLNRPAIEAHRAENDCILSLACSVAVGKDFAEWIDHNNVPFSEVKPMTIGMLVLTGALWGCTNPFIRKGTKGLRNVRAKGWLGQARAEIVFLLGNWRYVVPWLVNQCGSLSYLAAVQRAPLSLCVPAANGLAFAATAVVGAAAGAEDPLDRGSILGVILIVAGTALCCLEKAS